MASRTDSIDEIYLNPYEDIDDSTDVYLTPQHKINAALKRKDGAAETIDNSKKTKVGAVNKSFAAIYENDDHGMEMNSTSQNISNAEDISGIYFTPQDVIDAPSELRNKTSRQKNRVKSRYDSGMYALPDLPDDDSTERSRKHSYTPPPPTVDQTNCLKQFWEWRGRTITLIVAAFVLISLLVGVPLFFVMLSGNKGT